MAHDKKPVDGRAPSLRRRPNVLFIVVDDLRPQLGCYGHSQMISPNIDGLAASGVTFTRAFCQVPVCGASRASFLKGARPTRARFLDFKTWAEKDMPEATSLPLHFKRNGYSTVSVGKVYHHNEDDLEAWSRHPWRPSGDWVGGWKAYLAEGSREIIKKAREAGLGENKGPPFESADVPDESYPDGMIAEKAVSELRRLAREGEPFFLGVGFLKPHLPFNCPAKYWEMYRKDAIELADNPFRPKDAPPSAMHNWAELRNGYWAVPKEGPVSDDLARSLIHGYYACVSYTDVQVGKVLAELDRLGLRESTIVVFWGDHGWQLGEHGLWCKHCNFFTSLNAPMILAYSAEAATAAKAGSAPEAGRGARSGALTEFVDVYPTLCELAGLPTPEHLEGTSLVPLLAEPDGPWKRAAFSRYFDGDSVGTGRYVYTEWKREGRVHARMLYDHTTDPKENVNVAERPENAAVVSELSGMIEAGWREARPDR